MRRRNSGKCRGNRLYLTTEENGDYKKFRKECGKHVTESKTICRHIKMSCFNNSRMKHPKFAQKI